MLSASIVSDGSSGSCGSATRRVSYPDDVRTVEQQRFFLPMIFAADPPDTTHARTRRRRRRTHHKKGSDSTLPADVPKDMPTPVPAPAPAPAVAPLLALLPPAAASSSPAPATDDSTAAQAAHDASPAACGNARGPTRREDEASPDEVQFGVASAPVRDGRRSAGGWRVGRLIRLVSRLRRGGERRAASTTLERGTAAGTLEDKGEDELVALGAEIRWRPPGADETSTNVTGDLYEVSSNSERSSSVPLQHQRRRGQA